MIKTSSKQTGSAHVVIISTLVIALFSTLGFVFWQNFINKPQAVTKIQSSIATSEESSNTEQSPIKIDTSIHDVDIKMQSAADINQLPSYAPSSFKPYMQQILANNTASKGMFDCGTAVVQYQISKITQVNIEGGTVPVNEKGQTCSGGAPVIWVLAPTGSWDQETRNGIVCKSKNGGLIYEEFAPECYLDANSLIKNSNGSITSLNK
jgi:hypothetical protein